MQTTGYLDGPAQGCRTGRWLSPVAGPSVRAPNRRSGADAHAAPAAGPAPGRPALLRSSSSHARSRGARPRRLATASGDTGARRGAVKAPSVDAVAGASVANSETLPRYTLTRHKNQLRVQLRGRHFSRAVQGSLAGTAAPQSAG
eukprot:scaffold1947_cov207-Prasinococcus_capsulatus_cf.AAC.24